MRLVFILLTLCSVFATEVVGLEQIPAEVPGMSSLMDPTASTAVASPVDWWARSASQSGVMGRHQPWNPLNSTWATLIGNAEIPVRALDWPVPGVFVKTGNELGDKLVQEAVSGAGNPAENRTPMMDVSISTPLVAGFFAFVFLRQVDHFGQYMMGERFTEVGRLAPQNPDQQFSWFGENYPAFSALRGGASLQGERYSVRVQGGVEYLWLFGETGNWIGVKSNRVDGDFASHGFRLRSAWDSLSYWNQATSTQGTQSNQRLQLSYQDTLRHIQFGMDWSNIHNSGGYPFVADAPLRLIPWAGGAYSGKLWRISALMGANQNDWFILDTVGVDLNALSLETRTSAGSREHPFSMDEEWGGASQSIQMDPETPYLVQDLSIKYQKNPSRFRLEIEALPWIQVGARGLMKGDSLTRISDPLTGIRKTVTLGTTFRSYEFSGGLSHETRWGKTWERIRWSPSQLVTWLESDFRFKSGLRIGHVWQYQSSMNWRNADSSHTKIPGRLVWNAVIRQSFPKQSLELEATWLHVLVGNVVEVPGTNADRTRFMCKVAYRY